MTRDPRIDPRPGDVVDGDWGLAKVVAARGAIVRYTVRVGHQTLNSTMRRTLDEWRLLMKGARVVIVAGAK